MRIIGIAAVLGAGLLAWSMASESKKDPTSKLPPKNPLPPKPTPDPVVEPSQPEELTPYAFELYTKACPSTGEYDGVPGCYFEGRTYRIDYTWTSSGAGTRWRVFGPIAGNPDLTDWGQLTRSDAKPLGGGYGGDEEEARAAGQAFVDALPFRPQPLDGAAMPPMPPVPQPAARHGLLVSDCRVITVADPVEWVAWASRRLSVAARTSSPADAVGKLFAEGWPECVMPGGFELEQLQIAGRPVVEAIAEVAPILQAVRDGKAFASTDTLAPSPIEAAAAALVGVKLGRHSAPAFPWRGWVVRIEKAPWGYRWERSLPGVPQASARGGAATEKLAIKAAKKGAV